MALAPNDAIVANAKSKKLLVNAEAEQLLAEFIQNAPAVIAMFDRDMRYIAASARWKSDFQIDIDLIGRLHYEVFPEIPDEWKEIHRRAFAGEVLWAEKDRFERLDGTVQWLKWEVRPWYRAEREIGGIVIFSEDITEHATLHETLRINEERFRLVVEASPSGVIMTDCAGKIVLVNAETERLSGYPRAELIGRPIEILVPPDIRRVHPHNREAFIAHPKARAMGAGRDLHVVRKDGTELPVEIGLNPIRTGEGMMVLSAIVDISARKWTEARLQHYVAREQWAIAAVEASDDAIITKTLDGAITTWNPAAERLFGFTAQEAIGDGMDIIVPTELHDELRVFLGRLRAGEKIDHHETVRVAKDGRRIEVSVSISPLRSPSGAIIGAAKIARDITLQKQNQRSLARRSEELQRSNAELEQFAHVASHDLQEPLRGMSIYTELLLEHFGPSLAEVPAQYMRFIVDGAKRMQLVVKDLLAYARVDVQAKTSRPVKSGIAVRNVLDSLKIAIEEKHAIIVCDELPTVRADMVQLSQVFQNLIENALKFHGSQPPRIHLWAERNDDKWKFCVEDNGIGIDEQYRELVFQMFQRLHEHARYDGSGIGLAIAKKIVERHSGRIWFDSELENGSTFYFTMPAAEGNAI